MLIEIIMLFVILFLKFGSNLILTIFIKFDIYIYILQHYYYTNLIKTTLKYFIILILITLSLLRINLNFCNLAMIILLIGVLIYSYYLKNVYFSKVNYKTNKFKIKYIILVSPLVL